MLAYGRLAVPSHTVGDYLDVLESTFMIRRLPPYYVNVQKRLSECPKLYLGDTGLLHFLAGLRTPDQGTPGRNHEGCRC